jgi:hypothetical protein
VGHSDTPPIITFYIRNIPEGNKFKLNDRISKVKNVITINNRKLPNLIT